MSGGLEKMDEHECQAKAVEPAGDASDSPLCRAASNRVDGTSDFWDEFTALERVAKASQNVVREAIAAGNDLKATPTKPMAILARRLSDLAVIRLGVAP
jgi:hypothetical protein